MTSTGTGTYVSPASLKTVFSNEPPVVSRIVWLGLGEFERPADGVRKEVPGQLTDVSCLPFFLFQLLMSYNGRSKMP